MKTIISLLLLAITLLSSCNTCKRCAKKCPPSENTVTETIEIEKVRDSLIMLPPDSAWITALIECDSIGEAHIKAINELQLGNKITPRIELKKNIITAACKVDSAQIYLAWTEKNKKQTKSEVDVKTIEIEKPPTITQRFFIITGKIFIIVSVLLIVYFIFKIRKYL